jgi:ABC-type methionine transport system ATPase subunit
MNILGCLDRPTGGTYELDGRNVTRMGGGSLARVRNELIGFVFQSFELLPRFTALKNVELPLIYARAGWWNRRKRAKHALHTVGLTDRMKHRPNQLSGGQKQRVAIARAIILKPAVVLADEPTSALDVSVQAQVLKLFQQTKQDLNLTMIFVSHNLAVIRQVSDRVAVMRGGRLVESGTTADVFERPQTDYTRDLIAAVPDPFATVSKLISQEGQS